MRKIEIITRPFQLETVKQRLTQLGIQGMTVTEVKGFGRQRGHKEIYRGAEYQVDFVSKIKIEIVVDAALVEQVVNSIQEGTRTGKIGDGKIFVSPVENAVRIRTGESGFDAL